MAALALVALAILGAYQGWRRSAGEADVVDASEGLLPTTNAVAARHASALTEPPPPVLTEAQIRNIARQEAQALLAPRETAPAESAEATAPRPAPVPTPAPIVPTPAPVAPPAPASEADLPPLF